MLFPDARILLFAKAPIAGLSKTRLIPALGEQGAAELHARLVMRTLHTATRAQLCPVELWCDGGMSHPFFSDIATQFPVTLRQQQGADLGERMAHAFTETLKHARCALLIGSDCPALTPADLRLGLDYLAHLDCVVKPAEDGGYVMIGLREADPAVFRNIHWGGSAVMRQTRQRLETARRRWHEQETTWDVDRPEDLDRLAGAIRLS